MRTVKYTHLVEQDYSHAASLALTYLCPQLFEEGFDVAPPEVPAGWMREDCFERAPALALHLFIVPQIGTIAQTEAAF